ncbi:FUSC family protein [Herbaspirillum robiniae]|uniref:FUSC family protein n=1 Tax=Herbaspirillum robiniae TaxID=2014887 RepID=A0A246WUZ8_9BURK|nr:FUSC family protein [Herbaspirillum robiniae]NUU00129.1 FUSC family protein [Herbaspirillum robiniae]OWY30877.1 FUSC family protein [Herbaspirillum robiniae]
MNQPADTTAVTARASFGAQLREAAADWLRNDGPNWIYVFKMVFAGLLALGIGYALDLESPRSALITVFIVMQPQSGMILAKSFYRVIGTLIGSVAIVVFVGLFAQTPELFLLASALWIGLCTVGSAHNRNFRSYGFVLSGYTVALIGLPAALNPGITFDSVMTRVTEITVGIVCAGVVSALVFPQASAPGLVRIIRGRFSAFVDLIGATLGGTTERKQLEATNARFVGDIIGLEALRSSAIFEDPEIRLRSGRLTRMNSEFMALSTRVHALHQLMNRLHANPAPGAQTVIAAISPYFKEVQPLLTRESGEPVMSAVDAADAALKLEAYKRELPRRVRATRDALALDSDSAMLDFDTASELLYRVIEELHAYTLTYASLNQRRHEREQWDHSYAPKTSMTTALIAGARAAITLLLLSAFWLASGWPSGDVAALNAAAFCAITSAAPDPAKATRTVAIGVVFAAIAGYVYTFHILPRMDGYWMLAAALMPVLMLAVLLTTKPKWAGYGLGICIFFPFLAVPDNFAHFNAAGYLNEAIALMVSLIVTAVAFMLLLPPTTDWTVRILEKQLRKQVVDACFGKLGHLALKFESGTRDLMHQITMLTSSRPVLRQNAFGWMFATLEVGHAIIELRTELHGIRTGAPDLLPPAAYAALDRLRETIPALFERPNGATLAAALAANDGAIVEVQQAIGPHYRERSERHRLQRTLSYLHFIRTALLDEQSPLHTMRAGGADSANNNPGARHAT